METVHTRQKLHLLALALTLQLAQTYRTFRGVAWGVAPPHGPDAGAVDVGEVHRKRGFERVQLTFVAFTSGVAPRESPGRVEVGGREYLNVVVVGIGELKRVV